jgi:sugar phosphate permease
MEATLLSSGASDRRPIMSVRAMMLVAVSTGIMTQTALRSVPNLVMNGEKGMANEFNWLNAERGLILGSFGWGYTLTQLPGGVLSQLLGPRRTMYCAVLLGSIAGFAMPEGARVSFTVPMILNFVLGMAQGPVFPALKGLLAQWLRPNEMARGNSLMIASWNLGQVVQFLLSPLLLRTGGWPLAWYCYAACGVVWSCAWLRVAADSPEQHPAVSPTELAWIRREHDDDRGWTLPPEQQQQQSRRKQVAAAADKAEPEVAGEFTCSVCRRIVMQKPVVIVSLCAGLDGLGGAFANWMPQYYNTQLKYNLEATGLMIALPLLVAMVSNILGGLSADRVLAREWIHCTTRMPHVTVQQAVS